MAYIVKAQYGRYIINDESYSSIFVTTGNTIIFDVSHSSNADHPLKISTTKDGTHGVDENGNPGTELDDATVIVNNGVPGDPNAQIMFTPALDGIFYYYCEHHANMGSSITSVQTKFTDLGATAYDAQDGDITNRITKKIYKKDENNVFQLVASIDDSHGNPWEVLNIDITEQASYKIEYNAKGFDNIDASNQPLERYINIIPAFTRPEWLGGDLPIDEEGRIWAIQTVSLNHLTDTMPSISPFTYSDAGLLEGNSSVAVNYVILRNDSLDGANSSDFAPYSFANPSTGWDVGIPSTYDFLTPFLVAMFGRHNYYGYYWDLDPDMLAFIVPPGWECRIYKNPNYDGDIAHEVSQATVFHCSNIDPSSFLQENMNFNKISIPHAKFNRTESSYPGAMIRWDQNGGLYNGGFWPGSGYSYLFRKVAMPT